MYRIQGRSDAGALCIDHLLQQNGHRLVGPQGSLFSARCQSVGREKGTPADENGLEQRLQLVPGRANAEHSGILSGEAGLDAIFGCGGRANGEERLVAGQQRQCIRQGNPYLGGDGEIGKEVTESIGRSGRLGRNGQVVSAQYAVNPGFVRTHRLPKSGRRHA